MLSCIQHCIFRTDIQNIWVYFWTKLLKFSDRTSISNKNLYKFASFLLQLFFTFLVRVRGAEKLSVLSPLKENSYIQGCHIIVIDLRFIWWFLYTWILSDFHFLSKKSWSSISGFLMCLFPVILQNFLCK